MRDQSLSNIATLLFDPVPANRYVTRDALLALDARDVGLAHSLEEARILLTQADYDLLFVEATDQEDEVCAMVRDIRHGRLGRNPFVVILATSWIQSLTHVRALVDAGADDVILRPVSTAQLQTRIRQQIYARKPFVVSATYIGPDRRRDQASARSDARIVVPNGLKEKLFGNASAAMIATAIAKARAAMSQRRVEQAALKICIHCALVLDAIAEGADAQDDLAALRATIADLAHWADAKHFRAVLPHCEKLACLRLDADAAPGEIRKTLEQIADEARAVQRALDPRKSDDALKAEIAEAAQSLKARRATESSPAAAMLSRM
jgi:response regulator RpfG family c-di-GMP phosphodiesterase